MNQFVATVITSEQCGMENWRDLRISKVFDSLVSFNEVLIWARTIDHNIQLSAILISDLKNEKL